MSQKQILTIDKVIGEENIPMRNLMRITVNVNVMGVKPCIRGMRVTIGTIVGLVATGYSITDILKAYPYLEKEDIQQALAYNYGEF